MLTYNEQYIVEIKIAMRMHCCMGMCVREELTKNHFKTAVVASKTVRKNFATLIGKVPEFYF